MSAVYQDLTNIPSAAQGAVIAIGNFDGVHKGHQALIAAARDVARKNNAPLAVMTFEPHPREFFAPQGEPFRLTLLPLKQARLETHGVDVIFAPAFDADFSAQDADAFIALLKDQLRASHIVVGEDFAFGKNKTGGAARLRQALPATIVPPLKSDNGAIYSSTAVRAALQRADFNAAADILGWEWHMESRVVPGDQRGRTLGMPTANQKPARLLRIPYGVYAVEARVEGDTVWRSAVANFGIRPMFAVQEPLLETFIFDFDADIYGKTLCVRPVSFLRGEAKFDGLDPLIAQMKQDCQAARAALQLR